MGGIFWVSWTLAGCREQTSSADTNDTVFVQCEAGTKFNEAAVVESAEDLELGLGLVAGHTKAVMGSAAVKEGTENWKCCGWLC